MIWIITILLVVTSVFIMSFRLAKRNRIVTEREAEKFVRGFYETTKLDENRATFQHDGKTIKVTKEENRLINIAILFAMVFTAFEKKVPNVRVIDIMRWFSVLARENYFSDEELFAVRNYLLEPRATDKRVVYLEFSKELKKVFSLLIDNFQETMKSQYVANELQTLAIKAFVGDVHIVLSEFLPKKDFPKTFSELDYSPLK